MEELRDIKGLVEVTDYSLYYLGGLVAVTLLLLLVLAIFIYRYLTKKEPLTQRKVAIERLEAFEFGDVKQSVYEFSHLAHYAVSEDQREELEKLLAELAPYKFRKEVPELDDTLKTKMQGFIKGLKHG
ncbi:MAG: hypothetical protein MUP09_08280 [Thiovulaceae bacterium]|nr:hypothetical protein [Sulfurimonadaceae bacterium]